MYVDVVNNCEINNDDDDDDDDDDNDDNKNKNPVRVVWYFCYGMLWKNGRGNQSSHKAAAM